VLEVRDRERAEQAARERRRLLLPDLVLDHLALAVDHRLAELQAAHALGLELDRVVEVLGRQGLAVVRAVLVGRRADVPAERVDRLRVGVRADPRRALEHHVLEHVRRAAVVARLVLRARVVPDLDRHDRRGIAAHHRDLQPVGQREGLQRGQPAGCLRARFRGIGSRRCRQSLREQG